MKLSCFLQQARKRMFTVQNGSNRKAKKQWENIGYFSDLEFSDLKIDTDRIFELDPSDRIHPRIWDRFGLTFTTHNMQISDFHKLPLKGSKHQSNGDDEGSMEVKIPIFLMTGQRLISSISGFLRKWLCIYGYPIFYLEV